ncbi:PREDICTED: glioma tumor suppressor candidate region gene 1 protein-like [Chinchilla lanigera]|uniref:glioma tumor suppressor candidate region gene 1 protein-like n=1 Tax=Chinchilla lanigera TaxID=34839 RepID=UPI0006966361|nr:PREDICTED: glioma tumor suppressor candidate region gene 1 protein-like [Chinchilla lanigera]
MAAEGAGPQPEAGPEPGPGPGPGAHGPRLPLRKTYRENVGARADEATSGLIRELAAVEDELYQRLRKAAPTEPAGPGAPAPDPAWDAAPAPAAKRRKSESPDMDQASFSSDSPQDDALTEHLQSAIDSILNLQQPPGRGPHPAAPVPASPPPLHRPEAFPPSSHNGGLGPGRTLNR